MATVRLIAAPGLRHGIYAAGIDIVMTPGSHTYWKQPGEAGVPPVFAFTASQNIAKAEVAYPAPARISEAGIEAYGYTDRVVFPIDVTPTDGGKPVLLTVDVTYAVCNKICIPAHGIATLALKPDGLGLDSARLVDARAQVPVPVSPSNRRDLKISPDQGVAKPSWIVAWAGADPVEDVFADAPQGFYFETSKLGPNRFRLTAVDVPRDAKQVMVTLTLPRKDGSLLATETLDVTGLTR